MHWLYDLNTRLVATTELEPLFGEVLQATIELQGADFGHLQVWNADIQALEIVAQSGLGQEFLDLLARSDPRLACQRALAKRTRVVVEDVETDAGFAPYRVTAARTGFRAVQSTPLLTASGELVGMISTHFRSPHRPSPRELRLTDLYARQVAGLVERVRAEEERRRLAQLVENSTDFIGISSLDGQARFVNASGLKLVGADETHGVGRHILDYVHPDDRLRFEAEVIPSVERTGRWEGESSLLHFGTGAAIPVLQHIFYTHEAGTGRRLCMATICRDASERKRSEEALRSAQDQLTHAGRLSSMGELIASIAHEVSQPLAAVVTSGHAALRWLDHATPNLEEVRAAVVRILNDGERATEVVRRLRSLAMKRVPQETLLNVHELMHETLALTQREIVNHRVQVRLDLACTLALCGDRVQIQQVLLNLVVNAIAAMAPVHDRPRELVISASDEGSDEIVISVRDVGVGVLANQLDRMFEPFYTTKADGLGLGLSISQRIVAAHGGRIWAAPNDPYGLTLSITIPAQPWPVPPPAPAHAQAQ